MDFHETWFLIHAAFDASQLQGVIFVGNDGGGHVHQLGIQIKKLVLTNNYVEVGGGGEFQSRRWNRAFIQIKVLVALRSPSLYSPLNRSACFLQLNVCPSLF